MAYDPTIYLGSARYYVKGRPAYSAELASTLTTEVGLDGTGRLLDVGCGPGVVALELAGLFAEVIGLDPDADMLGEAAGRAKELGVENARWVHARAEDIAQLGLGECRVVTFGQSFHWTDRERVAETIYDLLEPGGALVLIVHTVEGREVPPGPDYPAIPHDEVRSLIEDYLGAERRAGQGRACAPADRYEAAVARTRFGAPRVVLAPGRPDIVRDIDSVVAGYYSLSWAAPHLFGDRRASYEADLRALLRARSSDGLFRDWPGDTEILIADKPA